MRTWRCLNGGYRIIIRRAEAIVRKGGGRMGTQRGARRLLGGRGGDRWQSGGWTISECRHLLERTKRSTPFLKIVEQTRHGLLSFS